MSKTAVDKSRRRFLKIGGLAGSGLVLGAYVATGGERTKSAGQLWDRDQGPFAPNAWLSIDRDDKVTVRINHSELGQGITTALAMIVAEELEADWTAIRVEIAPAEAAYKNPKFNTQMTAASTSVLTS